MPVSITKQAWGGWPNCYRATNGTIELIVTADVGPRIMRLAFLSGPNVFKEVPAQMGGAGEPDFQVRGGHRAWVAPERFPRTYYPDNDPVEIRITDNAIEATAPIERGNGIRKQLVVKMAPEGTGVSVTQRIQNTLPWDIELSHWALTMMAPGGVGFSGFPPRGTHSEVLLPTNPLVMWAFTDLSDPRWRFTNKYMILGQDPARPEPTKLGHFNSKTWGGYLLKDQLFIKRYTADVTKRYPDFGCSFETFANGETLELETLGPLTTIQPDEWTEHEERWSLHSDVHAGEFSDAELDRVLLPLL